MPGLKNDLFALQEDPSAKVRFQLLCTLGNINDDVSETIRQKLLMNDIEDKWMQVAALTSSSGKELALIENAIHHLPGKVSAGKTLFFQNCAAVIGLSQRITDIKKLMQFATSGNSPASAWWQAACLEGLSKSLKIRGLPATDLATERKLLLSKFSSNTYPAVRAASLDLLSLVPIQKNGEWNDVIKSARSVAGNKQADINYRNDALRLIGLENNPADTTLVEQIIIPAEPETLQQTALYTCNKLSEKAATACIMRNWKNLTHDVRDAAMKIFLSSSNNMNVLLDAVEQKQIQSVSISWPQMVHLMNNDDMTIRDRARKLLTTTEDRNIVYKKYEPALSLKGDAKNGLLVFQRVCSNCHQVSGEYGKAFGPDLASIRNRDAQFIMDDILNPNRSIADRYEIWTIVKKSGDKLSGIIASETPSAITLHTIIAQEIIVARNEIKTIEVSETSGMPAGLEAAVSIQEMADILSFLKNIH